MQLTHQTTIGTRHVHTTYAVETLDDMMVTQLLEAVQRIVSEGVNVLTVTVTRDPHNGWHVVHEDINQFHLGDVIGELWIEGLPTVTEYENCDSCGLDTRKEIETRGGVLLDCS